MSLFSDPVEVPNHGKRPVRRRFLGLWTDNAETKSM
jgi:hypothetical protein